ncbi:MAG: T9SS type A sorting domain-containing protein [Candidatus Cloacimonetes bacterium]|nr:T9SS type A sorting domain-containing protein [Candidatus Cloacimonadota bacterium]
MNCSLEETMRLVIVMVAVIMCITLQLSAIDHLELMNTLYGEFNGSWFGERVVSMDYNGDGYDDVIVSAPYWNPNGVYNSTQCWGKIYFYWGGPNMDNVPDFVMEGTQNWELSPAGPYNGGDINGDGIDDLVITLPVDPACVIAVYYGTANPTGVPDLTITIPYEVDDYIRSRPLGDINGDGRDDLVIHCPLWGYPYIQRLIIWTGNDAPFVTLVDAVNGLVANTAIGVGDVTGDGLDDYLLQYGIPGGTNMNSRIVLYYGSTNFPQVDSLVISENTNRITTRNASPLGDLNNDGFADFESYVGKVWFGGTDLTPNNDFELSYNDPYHEWFNPARNVGNPFIYGDLNGDGYDDVIGSTHQINYYQGEVGIWVGGPNMDGLIDLYLYPPSDYGTRNFGYAKAAGDFNGDGLCDLAISAPYWGQGPNYNTTGRVFIYSGNAALSDTMVMIDDPVEVKPGWELNVYPNPLRATDNINVTLTGPGNKKYLPSSLELYNLRGEKVSSVGHIGEVLNGTTLTIPVPNIANGLYILRVVHNNNTATTKKICILK